MRRMGNAPMVKKKNYVLSCFVAFSVTVVMLCFLNIIGINGQPGPAELILIFISVALACTLMSLTDKLPINSSFIIMLVDVGDIFVSIIGVNCIAMLIDKETTIFVSYDELWFVLLVAVVDYILVWIVFIIDNRLSERAINQKIKERKIANKKVEVLGDGKDN